MNQAAISAITARQRRFFDTGVTLDVRYRAAALERLHKVVSDHESELTAALRQDLGKSNTESYMCEIGMVLSALRWLRRNLRRLTKGKPQDKIDPVAALINSVYLFDLFNGNIQQ